MTTSEQQLLQTLLKERNLTGKHLEIGTAAGGTLCQMMASYPNEKRPPFVVIDPMQYFSNQLQTVKENLRNHHLDPETVDFRVMTSNEAFLSATKKKERFSFILIDAAHKIRYLMDDLRWTRLLEVGGVVCIHDYCNAFPDVVLAVDRFLKKHNQYQVVARAESLLVLEKRQSSSSAEVGATDRLYAMALAPLLQLQRSTKKRWSRKSP